MARSYVHGVDSMGDTAALLAAFDAAIHQVERARARGMQTVHGEPAAAELDALRAQLAAGRAEAARTGVLESDWIGGVIRGVAAWAPESDVTLLGALGAVARHRRRG